MDRISDVVSLSTSGGTWIVIVAAAAALFTVWSSLWTIGPTEVGLVRKRFSLKKLHEGNPRRFSEKIIAATTPEPSIPPSPQI